MRRGEFTDHPARVVSNISALRVRSSPAIEADNIIGQLQPGQRVHVLAREGDWQQVRSEDGVFGWSHSDYLIDLPPRQIGETRQFRINDESEAWGSNRLVLLDAELHYIGEHSYIYTVGHDRPANISPQLRRLGEEFDEHIYPDTFALWSVEHKPSHEGDERIVIVLTSGFNYEYSRDNGNITSIAYGAWYAGRAEMPGEPNPYGSRVGFLEIQWPIELKRARKVLVHELQHLIQHHVDGKDHNWVDEGLSVFTEVFLTGFDVPNHSLVSTFLNRPQSPLNSSIAPPISYGAGLLFITYIYERLGLEALQTFAQHPGNGLDALDEVLNEFNSDMDADFFFADWILANLLRNDRLGDGRYGYPLLGKYPLPKPPMQNLISQLPTQIQDDNNQYGTAYYQLSLPTSEQSRQLEFELHFANPYLQDAWLQLVQVHDEQILVQRFRAGEFYGQAVTASIDQGVERAYIAVSPFRPTDRDNNTPVHYTLSISTPETGDMTSVATELEATATGEHLFGLHDTNLLLAAAAGDTDTVSLLLLSDDIDIQVTDNASGRNSLHKAAAVGHDEVVTLLLLADIDINAQDTNGKTALMLAEEAGHVDVINLLFMATANIDEQAIEKPTSDEEIRAFVNSARTGNLSAVEQFINAGISLDKGYGEDRRTALMEAAAAGESNVVLQLLLAGAKPEISDYWGHRALNYALRAGNGEIAKMLIVAGAPLPSADNTGWTVLHIAAEYGESEIIRFLIDLGNVNNRYKYLLDVQAYGKKNAVNPCHTRGSN